MKKPRRLGLLSDSHGNLKATEQAINILNQNDCEIIIHLGDFCDTNRREHLEDLLHLFQEKKVSVVKGNNDYLIELALQNATGKEYSDPLWMYDYLKNVPMNLIMDDICFAHSFPFDYLRSFYEPIDVGSTERASLLFGQMSYRILFCGHSHTPIYFCLNTLGAVVRKETPLDKKILLQSSSRFIFVVGAAAEGECAVFDMDTLTYERIKFIV